MTDFLQWLGPGALIGLIGAIWKFGGDARQMKFQIETLKDAINTDRQSNLQQHLLFEKSRDNTIELAKDMEYLKSSVDKLVRLMEAEQNRRIESEKERRRAND